MNDKLIKREELIKRIDEYLFGFSLVGFSLPFMESTDMAMLLKDCRAALSRKYVPMTETQNEVIKWLALGETGSSSKCMAFWLAFGIRQKYSEHHYPADPDDMNRCLKLLQSAPGLRELLPKMAELGGRWAALVSRWDEIESMQMNEIGLDWVKARSAPKTYELMQEVIRRAGLEVAND